MITFLLFVAWGFFAAYCPNILYGYTWEQLEILTEDKTLQTTSELLKELGIVDENITQIASKRYYTCIAVVIGTLILVFIIRKLLKLLDQYVNRKTQMANAINEQKVRNLTSPKEKVKQLEQLPRTSENNIEIINQLSYLDDDTDDDTDNDGDIDNNNNDIGDSTDKIDTNNDVVEKNKSQ